MYFEKRIHEKVMEKGLGGVGPFESEKTKTIALELPPTNTHSIFTVSSRRLIRIVPQIT